MARVLSDEDVECIAKRVVTLMAERLTAPAAAVKAETKPSPSEPPRPRKQRLAYTAEQLSEELGVSRVTIYRLEQRGLIKSLPAVRRKIYSHAEVERLLSMSRNAL